MTFYFEWYVENRIILGCPYGDVHSSDYATVGPQVNAMLDQGQKPVHLIYDMRHIGQVHAPFMTVIKSGGAYLKHPKFGWGITFGQKQDRLLSFMSATAAQLFGIRNRVFDTAEEAQAFLMQIDDTLDLSELSPPYFDVSKIKTQT